MIVCRIVKLIIRIENISHHSLTFVFKFKYSPKQFSYSCSNPAFRSIVALLE
jgi:hypothetical protein